jgi:hypothetical protein
MRSNEAPRVLLLLLAAAAACCRQPATRPYGTVEIPLTGADAAGSPQRLYGEFTFSGVDNTVVGSASTQTAGTTDMLEVQLPAGRYRLTLNDEFVVESAAPSTATRRAQRAWVNLAEPPLVGVSEGQVTRVHFKQVLADPPTQRTSAPSGSRREAAPHADRMKQLSRPNPGLKGESQCQPTKSAPHLP